MAVIGIESSAHTFGVGIIDHGKILANEKSMYKIGTTGMIPKLVADFHVHHLENTIARAMAAAKISMGDIEAVGYTRGPGIGNCLQVGNLAAKTLAKSLDVKLFPVNHAVGHLEIVKHMCKMKDPLALYVSGGNSQILKLDKKPFRHYRVLGETFDIGVGNMLDNFARELKLNPAWGSSIEKTAVGGNFVDLPYTVKGMDFSFTGLLTQATKMIGTHKKDDLCFSIQEVAFSMLCEATERALLLTNSNEITVCGGVAQNTRLKEMLNIVAKDHGAKLGYTINEYDADNGAMIALVAENMFRNGYITKADELGTEQKYRIDAAFVY